MLTKLFTGYAGKRCCCSSYIDNQHALLTMTEKEFTVPIQLQNMLVLMLC